MKTINELIEWTQNKIDVCNELFSKNYTDISLVKISAAYSSVLSKIEELKKNTDWVKIDYDDKNTIPRYRVLILVNRDCIDVATWNDMLDPAGWYLPDGDYFLPKNVKYYRHLPS